MIDQDFLNVCLRWNLRFWTEGSEDQRMRKNRARERYYWAMYEEPGPRLNIKIVFPRYGISMLKIRRSWDRLIFSMGNPMLIRRHLYRDGPRSYISFLFLFFLLCLLLCFLFFFTSLISTPIDRLLDAIWCIVSRVKYPSMKLFLNDTFLHWNLVHDLFTELGGHC